MSSSKVEMSLDDIIKKDRKGGQQRGKKGGIVRKGKIGKKGVGGNKQRNTGGPANSAATKRLVQKLVKKALAQNNGGRKVGGRVARQVIRNANRGVNNRSRVIKKGPRSETVVIRKVVQQRQRQRPRQQVVREVIVQEPVRQRFVNQPARRFNNRPKIVYVEKRGQQRSFGGGFQQRQRFVQPRRDFDPFYEPKNYLQRL